MIVLNAAIILCQITKVNSNVFSSLRNQILCWITEYVQRFQITEVVFYTEVLVYDNLVGLERILDYTGVRLERFGCILIYTAKYDC